LGWRWTYLFWAFPILAWGFLILGSSHFQTKRTENIETKPRTGLKRWSLILSSGLIVFLTAIAVREVGASASSTYITTYFVKSRNLTESTASLIFGLGPFVGVPASLIGGYLGERTGARKALMWTIVGCAISLIVLGLVSHLYLLILVYVLFSFFSNAMWAPMNALVPDVAPMTDIGLGWSIYFFTDGITAAIAPTLAAGAMELSEISFVFPFSAIFLVSSLIILQFLPRARNQKT
jgi:predicted MFS family arabinose efflux permease